MKTLPFLSATKLLLTFILLAWSQVSRAQPCRIDQTENTSFALITTETAAGQNFTACESGVVTQIRVNFGDMNTQELRLQLSAGTNTLNPQYTQVIKTKDVGDYLIMLNTPFPVQKNQQYAFSLIGITGSGTVASRTSVTPGVYSGGYSFTETNGAVTNYSSDANFSVTIVEKACAIDQPTSNGWANITAETAVGQNFNACGSGVITHIRVNFGDMNTQELRLQLSAGNNTLTPQYTQVVKTNGVGNQLIPLSTPFPVQANQQYAYSLIGISGSGVLASVRGFNGDPYTSGVLFTEKNGAVTNYSTDSDFSVYITENACLIDQDKSNGQNASISTTQAQGQAFKACGSGWITHLRVSFLEINAPELRLRLSAGGNTLSPQYTQDFKIAGTGDLLIPLTTPFPVQDQQEYAFSIIGISGTGVLARLDYSYQDPYPGGISFDEIGGAVYPYAADDLEFSIVTLTPANASAAPEVVFDAPELSAFPNPATDRLTVRLESGVPLRTCRLTDIAGRTVVLESSISQISPQTELNLSAVPPGLYLLQVQAGEQLYSKKIVVQ